MKSHVHYEAAFEDYLRRRGIPYVAVDEAKKAVFRDARLKSFDFIVYSASGHNRLVDVKGRRWGPRGARRTCAWENWTTQEDLDGLRQWEEVFGDWFRALLLFAYELTDGAPEAPDAIVHVHRDRRYVFAGVPLEDYRLNARVRSPRWGTVSMPVAEFARYVRPVEEWLA